MLVSTKTVLRLRTAFVLLVINFTVADFLRKSIYTFNAICLNYWYLHGLLVLNNLLHRSFRVCQGFSSRFRHNTVFASLSFSLPFWIHCMYSSNCFTQVKYAEIFSPGMLFNSGSISGAHMQQYLWCLHLIGKTEYCKTYKSIDIRTKIFTKKTNVHR